MGSDALMTDDNVIFGFFGEYRFLSNFWPVPRGVYFEGLYYSSVEHAYQAGKTMDIAQRKAILRAPSALDAKSIGKHIVIRPGWDDLKLLHMEGCLRNKFKRETQLVKTGTAKLVENNTWNDRFWGKCRGAGKNHMGLILMDIREDLINDYPPQGIPA
jgi:ribA/ribD-fused uncharacterized protein